VQHELLPSLLVSVAQKQQLLLEAFSIIPDRQERLAAIVERARRSPPLRMQNKTPVQRVPGCVSPVWLHAEMRDGRLKIRAEAESPVVNGLVRLLCEIYDDAAPAEILNHTPTLLEDLGLLRDLTPTRRNGLAAVLARIRAIAAEANADQRQ
jgi:cysteine desulfuration protein SufE